MSSSCLGATVEGTRYLSKGHIVHCEGEDHSTVRAADVAYAVSEGGRVGVYRVTIPFCSLDGLVYTGRPYPHDGRFPLFGFGQARDSVDQAIADHLDDLEYEKNERLMEVAPALLDALEGLLECPDLNHDSLEPSTLRAIETAREAYQQATGKEIV